MLRATELANIFSRQKFPAIRMILKLIYSALTMPSDPGPPLSLTVSSVSVTNITIQWDSIPCQDRNQRFDSSFRYRVIYHPLSDVTAGGARFASLSSREFMAPGLPLRTSFIFRVQAFNLFTIVQGLSAELTVNTTEPQGELLSLTLL